MIYKHYKGKYYLKLFTVKDCETLKNKVVYMALYRGIFKFGQVWVRDEEVFDGYTAQGVKRFKWFNLKRWVS